MKKALLLLMLSVATFTVMAQPKKQWAADSFLKKHFEFKPDTNLFKNKLYSYNMPLNNGIKLNTLQPNALKNTANVARVTYDKLDNMPVLRTEGNSKMPVAPIFGNSKMPVVGKDTANTVTIERP